MTTQTIQATGKGWKALQAVGAVLAIAGFVAIFAGAGPLVMLVGVALAIGGKLGAWWMHG